MLTEAEQADFTRLWTTHQRTVSQYLLSLVTESHVAGDLLQGTALVLLRKFTEYDRRRPFLPWALGVAKRELLACRRDAVRSRLTFCSDLLDQYTERWAALAERSSERSSDESLALQRCLRRLPDKLRELLRLRYFEDLNSQQISARLQLTADHVRVTLQRTRERLRACVERQLSAEEGAA
jgi:RNA polymerase sigma-70 factor (ECF subfamily)